MSTMIAGCGFARMAWELAWKRAMPMFPNDWAKGNWPEPRETVDLLDLPASFEYYRIINEATELTARLTPYAMRHWEPRITL